MTIPRRTRLIAAAAAFAALAAPAGASADGATRFASCPELALVSAVDGYAFSMCFSTVITPGGDGHARFSGELLPGVARPSRTLTLVGFPCLSRYPLSLEFAAESRILVTPGGRVTGTCRG